jgi:tetratricopeptide (TPR) repeat protein
MKKILTLIITACSLQAFSQMTLPDLSPEGKVIQKIGYTNFVIRYERPAARGRKIFGDLVPYGKLWRTGAGKGTSLQFDQPVTIGGKEIKPDIYALVSIPGKDEWTILLNSDTSKIYGAPEEYDTKTEVARFLVKPEKVVRFFESFTLDLDVVKNNGELYLSWENTQVHFPIITNSNNKALEEINKTLSQKPDDADNLSYAAYYLNMNNENPQLLLPYIDKALKIREDWWYYEIKVDLLAKLKRWDEAKLATQQGIDLVSKTKPVDWEITVQHFKEKAEKFQK